MFEESRKKGKKEGRKEGRKEEWRRDFIQQRSRINKSLKKRVVCLARSHHDGVTYHDAIFFP